MGSLMRSLDWDQTALGPVAGWSHSLRTMVGVLLRNPFAMNLFWGPQFIHLYNDGYRAILGAKHPRALGQPCSEIFKEVWDHFGKALLEPPFRGEPAICLDDLILLIDRKGFIEETHFKIAHSPVPDETALSGIGGVLATVAETTQQVFGERQLKTLRELAVQAGTGATSVQACESAAATLKENSADVPFCLFYLLDPDGNQARLVAGHGFVSELGLANPAVIQLHSALPADAGWPITRSVRDRVIDVFKDLPERFTALPKGPWAESPRQAISLPLASPEQPHPYGVLIAGVNPHRELDDGYQTFFELAAGQVVTAIHNGRAREEERARAEQFAAIDRAKTAFLSSVSHEFRTPLTLMLGPTEDAIASPERALRGPDLELVYRNELRLLKLVNSLLDFSRLEAERWQASFQPTDLSALTADLAGAFRSTVERAGLRLVVDCPPLAYPVWADREMWEKIVLNLLSNAFKFTLAGEIYVQLQWLDDHVKLSIKDSGTGISEEEQPRIFNRFYRVQGAGGRSYEGSGIGLALVQEMVRLHGGTLQVQSCSGAGSTFSVSLPTGNAHLPQEQLHPTAELVATVSGVAPYVHEAAQWMSAPLGAPEDTSAETKAIEPGLARPGLAALPRHVLIADDNADMRHYLRRLLEGRYTVEVVADGRAALEAVQKHLPDLILADVLMPRLDGFGLLRELQREPKTAVVPVILLSARAGVEATLDGLAAGARDYLVKPFSARELVARVEGSLKVARERARVTEILESMGDAFFALDQEFRFILVNSNQERVSSRPRSELLGRILWEVFPEAAKGTSKYWTEYHRCMEERAPVQFVEYYQPLDLWTGVRAYPTPEGGIAVFFRDISEEKRSEEALKRQAGFEQQLVGIVSHDLRNPLSVVEWAAASLIRRGGLDELMVKNVLRIQSASARATRLVRDLLDFTSARLGKGILITRLPLNAHEVVQGALEDVRSAFPDRELSYNTEGDGHGEWDGDRLVQVVQNLATNAFRYSPSGTPVRVKMSGTPDAVVLEIHNGGLPIAPDLLPELFKPLRGRTQEGARKIGSIGLGLYIVDQLVRAHGGTVTVRSEEGEGTAFTVRLPRSERDSTMLLNHSSPAVADWALKAASGAQAQTDQKLPK